MKQNSVGNMTAIRRLGYASGDFANNFSWALVSGYLMYFWTDVAMIPAALCGTLMLISKGWDAINDPIIGALSDRTKSKWGRYRPWILYACIPMLIFNILSFRVFASDSINTRAAYAIIIYMILVLAYTCVNIPYSAMPATLTRSDEERSKLASWRMTGAFIATLILSQGVLRVVKLAGNGDEAKGFFIAAIIFSLIALPIYLFCFAATREVVEVPIPEKISAKVYFAVLKGNRPVNVLIITFICWGFYEAAIGATRLYYFKYYVGNADLFMLNASLMFLGRAIGTFSLSYLVLRVSNKRTLPLVAFLVSGVLMIIMNFLPVHSESGLAAYHAMTFLTGIGGGLGLASLFGMVPDCSEVTQYKYHTHAIGFVSAFINFAFKLGMAICTAVIGWVLAAYGYVANGAQNEGVLTAINYSMNMVVGVILIVGAAALYFYNIDKKTYSDMLREVEHRIAEKNAL